VVQTKRSNSVRSSEQLYNRIAVLRAERQLSRQQLADAVGVGYQTIGYLERGEYNPSLDLALRIAELFGLPVEAVFSRTPFTPLSRQLYSGNRLETAPRSVS
jgi:putative transcriptional regulator